MSWFRFYGEALNDPDIQSLPPEVFKVWVNVLCMACNMESKTGDIGTINNVSFALRETKERVSSAFHHLIELRYIVTVGETFHIKNWSKRQYKSDTSTDRVRKYRKRSKTVTETAPEQSRYRADTEQIDTTHTACASATDFEMVYTEGCTHFPALAPQNTTIIRQWLEAGCSVHDDILPEIRRCTGRQITSWKFFTGAIMDAKASRETPLPKGNTNGTHRNTKPRSTLSKALEGLYLAGIGDGDSQQSQPVEYSGSSEKAQERPRFPDS